jgi:phage terminase large subunit-like protein
MSEPSKEFEKIVVAKQCGHLTPTGINPVMRWMLSNVAVKRDPADNIKPDKSRASGRIDGVVGSIMALGRAMVAPAPAGGSWLVGSF